MKNLLMPLLAMLFLFSCEKESTSEMLSNDFESLELLNRQAVLSDDAAAIALIEALITQVEKLQDDGDIGNGPANSILSKLKSIKKKLEQGKTNETLAKIANLISHLEGLADDGLVDPSIIYELIDSVNEASCETAPIDGDGDGWLCNEDCDDNNGAINPGATEICDNTIDDDCNGDVDEADSDCSTTCVEGELELTLPDGTIIYVHQNDQNSGSPQSDGIQWGGYGTDIPDLTNYINPALALGDYDGEANTDKIYVELTTIQGVTYSYAAKRCKELSTETGCDWYLPALGELKAIYDEYGNTAEKRTDNNFEGYYYWSSTKNYDDGAWVQNFDDGRQFGVSKYVNLSCRCVRR